MSLNWDVPLKNGKDVFFTEESFNIFNNFITFEERFLKRLEDHDAAANSTGVEGVDGSNGSKVPEVKPESTTLAPGDKEAAGKQASYNKLSTDNRKTEKQNRFSTEDEAQSRLKLALHITKGRLPPPRKSSLCHEDQKLYLTLYSKYGGHSPADPTEEEITELNKLKVLQAVVKKEQEEYHQYSLSLATALQVEYHYMDASARKYMEARLTARRREVEMYPSHYNIVSSFSLKGAGQVSPLTYIKPLLQLGSVPKMIIPTVTYDGGHQLTIDTAAVRQENPIRSSKGKEANWNHEACSMDENAEVMAVQHRAHIVISPGALMCLVDNHAPDYSRGWELPFSVKEYDVIEGDKKVRHRIVYIDKAFASTNVMERAKNTKFYKLLLRNIFCRHNSKDQSLDQSSGVDAASKKTEDKRSKGEGKESTDKQAPVSQLGDIFDIGKASMEEVETFGTSSFESFKTKKKSETSNTLGSENKTFGASGNSAKIDKIGKANPSSRKVKRDSFNIFSDETVEDIETFGLNISREKSTKKMSSSKVKNKEIGQISENNIVIETSATLSKATAPSSTVSSDVKQTPSSPVSQTLSTSTTVVTGSTSAGSDCISSNTDTPLSSVGRETGDHVDIGKLHTVDMGKLHTHHVSMETPTESHVSMDTPTDNNVTIKTQTNSNVTIETPEEGDVTMETQPESNVTVEKSTEGDVIMETPTVSHVAMEMPTESHVAMETPTESCVAMETPTESCVAIKTPTESHAAIETPTESCVAIKTPTESHVTMETHTESHAAKETLTESHVAIETPTESHVTMETHTESHAAIETPTESHVTMETQPECHVTMETHTESHAAIETPTESHVAIETPTESHVTMETQPECHVPWEKPTESDVSMETLENNVKVETGDSHLSDKMCVRTNGRQGLKEMPYALIPIDLPAGATAQGTQGNSVAMDANSNPTDKTEHEVIMDAPASPVSTETPSSPCITDSASSPSEGTLGPKIIPLSVEKLAPESFHSPDFKSCVLIPLEGEGNINENIVMDHTQGNNEETVSKGTVIVSPPLPQRRSKVRRSTTALVVSDLDSDDDEKLLIDVSPIKDSESEKADGHSTKPSQVIKSKSQSNNNDCGKALGKKGSFYEKNTNKDGSGSTRVTRSRQSLDTIMAQMKSSSSVIDKPQRKKGDKMSKKMDRNESNNSNCESRNVIERCTRSTSLSETSRSSSEVKPVEVKSEFISCDQTLQTSSKAKSSVPESDSDSCFSMDVSDVDVKDRGSKVKRRSSRLSTGSSSCSLEVKSSDRTVKACSKVMASDIITNICHDVKSEETEVQPVVVRKRGRPRKILSAPPLGSSTHLEEPRPRQDPADTEATSVEEDNIGNPIPVKRKRGRPPKQKVGVADKPVETELKQIDDTGMDNRSKVGQTGSEVKALAAKSTQKTASAETHVSRVKPRLVATLTPRAEDMVAKQTNTKKKDSGPRSGSKKLSTPVSTFDSILQGMQNMLHAPDQKVSGSQCPGPSDVSNTSTLMKQPDGQSNVSYHLWSLGGFQVVVRCGYHGTIRDDVQKLSKVHLCTKMEYQSSEGLEQVTTSETCRSWISGYIRPQCKLLRARINPLKSELIALEELGLSQLIGSQQTFRPGDAFLMLQNVFHKLHLQPPGQYLLHHGAGDRNCNIKKCTDMKKRGSYDLHFQHFGFMTTNTPNSSVPWLPIDPSVILPSHMTKGRVPATFEPADYTAWIPPKNNKGKKKKKQTKPKQRV
ncbi:little elongation complex subunit 2-like [Mizuhopecten yessoensis]|nr:little elongation complex subunit 2-like [Mizuhopecten yessoensis]